MNTVIAPTVEEFGDEAHTFLDANAELRQADGPFVWGQGHDKVAMFEERDRDAEGSLLREACGWRATRFDAGLGWITGPVEYGGRGLSAAHQRAYDSLEAKYTIPNQSFFVIGLGMVAPTILAHGSEQAKQQYLTAMYRGDTVACQLFSEPGAGSDLASLQTKAERDGDEWVISGQKVWTSGAHFSRIGEIIARTDANLPKHQGLTGFIVDMHAPGVEIRPLRQMTGGANFNEVFFNEVRVPDQHRLGELNEGWRVALTTLMNERAAIGGGGGNSVGLLSRAIEMVKAFELNDDPVIRQELADLVVRFRVQQYTNQRSMDRIRSGQLPGPEMSIAKLVGSINLGKLCEFVAHVLGPKLIADTGEWGTYAWGQMVLGQPGGRIAGGSDEIMRNIVGERVLGLQKDTGIDTTSPFNDLKVGTQRAT